MTSRHKLIAQIIKKKLSEEVDQILTISRQGFDVFAQVEFPEVKSMLLEILEESLKSHNLNVRVLDDQTQTQLKEIDSEREKNYLHMILVGENKLEFGYGFVHYQVRSPDQLLGNVAVAIEMILEYFNLGLYIDVFDAKKLARLKQIARVQGVKCLIDSVIQTAYYGGYKGDNETAQTYLDRAEFLTDASREEMDISLENCAKKFLSHAVTHGQDAHSFIKSCLSYFVVSKQGHTMTRASQILSISRTTLLEHLKIANQLGVSSFLEGSKY